MDNNVLRMASVYRHARSKVYFWRTLELASDLPCQVVCDGDMARGVPAAPWKLKDGADPRLAPFALAERLRVRGWQVPACALPANCRDQAVQRVLLRNGASLDLCARLVDDMKASLAPFAADPVAKPPAGEGASGFQP